MSGHTGTQGVCLKVVPVRVSQAQGDGREQGGTGDASRLHSELPDKRQNHAYLSTRGQLDTRRATTGRPAGLSVGLVGQPSRYGRDGYYCYLVPSGIKSGEYWT